MIMLLAISWHTRYSNNMGPGVPDYDSDGEWRMQAACKKAGPELFFPDGYSLKYADAIDAAKAFCGRCVVREECLDYAITIRETNGIWGGATPNERRALIRAKKRAT